jgi:hypothetical protein
MVTHRYWNQLTGLVGIRRIVETPPEEHATVAAVRGVGKSMLAQAIGRVTCGFVSSCVLIKS